MHPHNSLSLLPVATVFFLFCPVPAGAAAADPEHAQGFARIALITRQRIAPARMSIVWNSNR
jgi:hypothetical protein